MRRLLSLLCALSLIGLIIVSSANAKSSYTVTVNPVGPYVFGEKVMLSTNIPSSERPWLHLHCYEPQSALNGKHSAYDSFESVYVAGFPGGENYLEEIPLGPTSNWTGQSAVCEVYAVKLEQVRERYYWQEFKPTIETSFLVPSA